MATNASVNDIKPDFARNLEIETNSDDKIISVSDKLYNGLKYSVNDCIVSTYSNVQYTISSFERINNDTDNYKYSINILIKNKSTNESIQKKLFLPVLFNRRPHYIHCPYNAVSVAATPGAGAVAATTVTATLGTVAAPASAPAGATLGAVVSASPSTASPGTAKSGTAKPKTKKRYILLFKNFGPNCTKSPDNNTITYEWKDGTKPPPTTTIPATATTPSIIYEIKLPETIEIIKEFEITKDNTNYTFKIGTNPSDVKIWLDSKDSTSNNSIVDCKCIPATPVSCTCYNNIECYFNHIFDGTKIVYDNLLKLELYLVVKIKKEGKRKGVKDNIKKVYYFDKIEGNRMLENILKIEDKSTGDHLPILYMSNDKGALTVISRNDNIEYTGVSSGGPLAPPAPPAPPALPVPLPSKGINEYKNGNCIKHDNDIYLITNISPGTVENAFTITANKIVNGTNMGEFTWNDLTQKQFNTMKIEELVENECTIAPVSAPAPPAPAPSAIDYVATYKNKCVSYGGGIYYVSDVKNNKDGTAVRFKMQKIIKNIKFEEIKDVIIPVADIDTQITNLQEQGSGDCVWEYTFDSANKILSSKDGKTVFRPDICFHKEDPSTVFKIKSIKYNETPNNFSFQYEDNSSEDLTLDVIKGFIIVTPCPTTPVAAVPVAVPVVADNPFLATVSAKVLAGKLNDKKFKPNDRRLHIVINSNKNVGETSKFLRKISINIPGSIRVGVGAQFSSISNVYQETQVLYANNQRYAYTRGDESTIDRKNTGEYNKIDSIKYEIRNFDNYFTKADDKIGAFVVYIDHKPEILFDGNNENNDIEIKFGKYTKIRDDITFEADVEMFNKTITDTNINTIITDTKINTKVKEGNNILVLKLPYNGTGIITNKLQDLIVRIIYLIKNKDKNVLLYLNLEHTLIPDDSIKLNKENLVSVGEFFLKLRYNKEYGSKFEAPPEIQPKSQEEISLGGGAIKDNKIKLYKFKKLKLRI